jgi:quercetin dioxygenase-like cupin family protein
MLQALALAVAMAGCATDAGHSHPTGVDEQDAVIAAGNHHIAKLENDRVRVLETVIKPGETVPLHTHRWPSVQYTVEVSELVVRDAKGVVLSDSRKNATKRRVGDILWGTPRELHTVENVGHQTARVISVEIKDDDVSR